MQKHIVFALCVSLLSVGAFAQSSEMAEVLRAVEQNNQELQAFHDYMESRLLELKSQNNLPDPQASAFYLPFGTHSTSDYSEFQLSQSMEFPTVYAARSHLIEQQKERMQLDYQLLRQKVLLPAIQYAQELIYLHKKKSMEQTRMQQARQVYEQVQELYEKEQLGVLELNKAKIAWMQEQFAVEEIENSILNTLLSLQKLNGGKEITFEQTDFTEELPLAPMDSLWQEKQVTDAALKVLEEEEAVARQQIKLSRQKVLPNLTAGYNYQGLLGENYHGVYGGLSIPLWNSSNKVKAAKAQYQYQQSYTQAIATEAFHDFQKQYSQYQLMFSKYMEYQETLAGIQSEDLLLQAYQLGEISFLEYYLELQFYRKAYDQMLEMERHLYQIKAELLKHQL